MDIAILKFAVPNLYKDPIMMSFLIIKKRFSIFELWHCFVLYRINYILFGTTAWPRSRTSLWGVCSACVDTLQNAFVTIIILFWEIAPERFLGVTWCGCATENGRDPICGDEWLGTSDLSASSVLFFWWKGKWSASTLSSIIKSVTFNFVFVHFCHLLIWKLLNFYTQSPAGHRKTRMVILLKIM